MSSLQELVDALADELGRSVGVDDRRFRALAYSPQDEGVDRVRRDSILRREAPATVTRWLLSMGIEEAAGHVRIPANPELAMDPRLCFPLRFEDATLGYLWLIDRPAVEDPNSLAVARGYAEQLAAELVRVRRLADGARERHSRALLALLAGEDSAAAAAELIAAGVLTGSGNFVVALAQFADPSPEAEVHLSLAAEEVRRGVAAGHALAVAQPGAVVLALAFEDAAEPAKRAAALLAACRSHLAGEPQGTAELVVGVGAPRAALSELAGSHLEARLAGEVGRRVATIGTATPVHWDELGAYRGIVSLLGDRDPTSVLTLGLDPLLAERDGLALIETVEAYLDRGADVKGTAAALFLHRSSLYKRLHRIERLTGYDLRRGEDRLELHLGLRLWRLAGGGRSSPKRD